jgi:hypothetical protein
VQFQTDLVKTKNQYNKNKNSICLIVGHPGSSISILGSNLLQQISTQSLKVLLVDLDFSEISTSKNDNAFYSNYVKAIIQRDLGDSCVFKDKNLTFIIIITLRPHCMLDFNLLTSLLSFELSAKLKVFISAVSLSSGSEVFSERYS